MQHTGQRAFLSPSAPAADTCPQDLQSNRRHERSLHAALKAENLTSTSLFFSPGFLIYQVDVRKVSANTTTSFFPDSSKLDGVDLRRIRRQEPPCARSI